MLSKQNRLPIQNFPRQGVKNIGSANLVLKIWFGGRPSSRFGVIISKKTAKTAVVRNQMRRAVFIAAEGFLSRLPVADYLLIINKALEKDLLIQEVKDLLSRALKAKP